MIAVTFRTDDLSRWGVGSGQGTNGNLTATQADLNVWEIKSAVEDILANPPSPVQIAAFEVAGIGMIIRLTDGTAVGPLPLPVLAWRWRDAWIPNVPYAQLDVFRVAGFGLYLVLLDHTSASSFDPTATDGSGHPLYRVLFGTVGDTVGGAALNGALASGCSQDWGLLGAPISSSGDWGTVAPGEAITLKIDLGLIGQ